MKNNVRNHRCSNAVLLQRVSNSLDLLLLLPTVKCLTPLECLNSPLVTGEQVASTWVHTTHKGFTTIVFFADTEIPLVPVVMDSNQLRSEPYQRVFQYLNRYKQGKSVDAFTYSSSCSPSDDQTWIQLIHR